MWPRRLRNIPLVSEEEILNEFTQNISDYSSFPSSDSDYMAIHAGSMTMQGGIFAYANNEGLSIAPAFPDTGDAAKGMAAYHILQQYPKVVGNVQNSLVARADRKAELILWQAGKELYNNDRHVLGGLVLMAFERDLATASRTLLLPFAAKAIGRVIRTTEEEALRGEIPATEDQKQFIKKLKQDEKYDENIENIAIQVLAAFFPRPRQFRKLLGLRPKIARI